jgi:hypothetical protein
MWMRTKDTYYRHCAIILFGTVLLLVFAIVERVPRGLCVLSRFGMRVFWDPCAGVLVASCENSR